ncbi:MAG: AI-2E family transporter [Clostridiales bacterium]|nr:AI-2E family transporter [Clostridiales bacterium]
MEISKRTRRYLMQIIAFGILLYCGVEHFNIVIMGTKFLLGIAMPFLVGSAIAFVINVPMRNLERHLFPKNEKLEKFRRPVAYLLTLAGVVGLLFLAMVVIIPELASTITTIVRSIPKAFGDAQKWLLGLSEEWPALEPAIAELNIDWAGISASAVKIIQGMATGLLSSGVGFFSGIVSGVMSSVIAFTFSIYLLFQKERLSRQAMQVFQALLPDAATEKVLRVASLSNEVFSNFLSGQCLEAVILGTMFFVAMTIFRMPYAMLTGVVIAITALVPIFGAFVGCAVGALLIAMVNPVQALWFIVLFLVLQQLEGNLIYPHVVGGSIGLPSIWVLVAVSLGGDLFGIAGIILFIPLCSVLYALFREFVKKRLEEKGRPVSAEGKEPQK